MAGTTTTTLAPSLNTEIISPLTLGFIRETAFLADLVRQVDIIGLGSLKYDFNSFGSFTVGSVAQGTDNTPAALTTVEDGTVTAAEVSGSIEPSKVALDVLRGRIDTNMLAQEVGAAIGQNVQSAIATAFASFTNSTGTSGAPLTLADFEDASFELALRGAPKGLAPANYRLPPQFAGYAGVLTVAQMRDLNRALRQSGNSMLPPDTVQGLGNVPSAAIGQMVGSYGGVRLWQTTSNTTANAAVDGVGALFVAAALGYVYLGMPEVEVLERANSRAINIGGRFTYGVGVIKNVWGEKLVTSAS